MWALVQFSDETYNICKIQDIATKNDEAVVRYRGGRFSAKVLNVNANKQDLLKLKEKLEDEHLKEEENEAIPNTPGSITANDKAANQQPEGTTSPEKCSNRCDNKIEIDVSTTDAIGQPICLNNISEEENEAISNTPGPITANDKAANQQPEGTTSPEKCSNRCDNNIEIDVSTTDAIGQPICLNNISADIPEDLITLSYEGGMQIVLEDETVDIHKLTIQNSPTKIWQFRHDSGNCKTIQNCSSQQLCSGEAEDENDVALPQNEPNNSDDGSEYLPEMNSSDESCDEQIAVSNATNSIHKDAAQSSNSTSRLDSTQIANVVGHSAPDDQEMFVMTAESGTKRDYCLYCNTMQAKLSRHVVRRHRGQEEVAEYLSYPVGSDDRKKLMAAIRKKANFAFNTNKNLNTGERKVARRPTEKSGKTAIDFATCPACLGDYAKDSLRHHVQRCKKRCTGRRDILIDSKKVTGRIHREASNILRQNIYPTMQEDEVVRAIRYDELITRFGNKQCEKYKAPHQYDMIRRKLRHLGRFLLEFRKHAKDVRTFYDVFLPKNYDATVTTVRLLAGLNESQTGFHAPSLASALGTLLKQVGHLCISEYIKQQNKEKQILAEDYIKLLVEDYPTSISRTVLETHSQQLRQKKVTLPSFGDIRKLQVYLRSELEKNYDLLKEEFSLTAWLDLGSCILVLLLLFNRRRPGETERILIKDFENYEKIGDNNIGEYQTFSIKEKEAAQKYVRFVIRGKLNRTVPVLMHQELLVCTQQLLSMRNLAKVDKNNPYIFGTPGRVGGHFKYLRGCELLRRYAGECGAEKPETLRATILRKHVATVCAHINLTDSEVSDLANFMGHADKIHRAHYRQPAIARDILHVSKLLEVVEGKALNIDDDSGSEEETTSLIPTVTDTEQENNRQPIVTSSRQDLTLDSIADSEVASKKRRTRSTSPYGICKRVRWTTEEKNIILKEFKENIENKKLPSLKRIQEIVDKNQVLTKRNLASIKTWIANQFKKNA